MSPFSNPPSGETPYYQAAHDTAVSRGKDGYIDPKTGYLVFSELYHLKRGYCCQSGCRHCPYGFLK